MATSKEMTAGPALPLIFNFTLPLLFGNLLQQTYSLLSEPAHQSFSLFWVSATDVAEDSVSP